MTETYDGIEWEIDDFPSITSSGDETDEWIHEFEAQGIDENGNEIHGTAYYTENWGGLNFDYVDYELPELQEDDEDEEDEEE